MSIFKINNGIRNWWEKREGTKKEEEEEIETPKNLQDELNELVDKKYKISISMQELANKYEIDSMLSPIDRLTSGGVLSNLQSELMVLVDGLVRIHPEVKKDPFVEDYYKRLSAFAKDTEEYRKERDELNVLIDEKVKEIQERKK